jgi:hypothetical protein
MIERDNDAFVNVDTAESLGLEVGDELRLSFWVPSYNDPTSDLSRVVDTLGTIDVRVVGIGAFADEVLVDELFPRRRVLISADAAAPYDCTIPHPSPDDSQSIEVIARRLVPPDCALSFHYYSLRVDGGAGGVAAVVDALSAAFLEASQSLPAALLAEGAIVGGVDYSYSTIPTVTADDEEAVRRSLDPAVTALRLFGVAAIVSTIVVTLLGAVRLSRRVELDAPVWRQLGVTRRERVIAGALPLVAAALTGLGLALAVAWAASGIGPVASARTIEPGRRLALDPALAATTSLLCAVALVAGAVAIAVVATRATGATRTRRAPWLGNTILRTGSPAMVLGVRAAGAGSGARALLGASVAAVAAVLATTVFATSLGRFVDQPAEYGWPFDVGVMVGFGYGGADREAIAATLDRREVESWTLAGASGDFTLDGRAIAAVSDRGDLSTAALPIIEGVLPAGDQEIAVGALTAGRHDLQVGSTVEVTTPGLTREATVSGIVVLPPLGAFQSARASLGDGMLLSRAFLDALVAPEEQELDLPPGSYGDSIAAFVGIELRDGVDPTEFLQAIGDDIGAWDVNRYEPYTYADPARPPVVADLASVRAVPVLLGIVFAVAMGAGLALGIAVGTRDRRRELAQLRALGCTGRQLRASVRWHALSIVAVGILLGGPLGVAAGRSLYRQFALDLGVAPQLIVSPLWVTVVVLGAVLVGLLAAALPGRRSALEPASAVLRDE